MEDGRLLSQPRSEKREGTGLCRASPPSIFDLPSSTFHLRSLFVQSGKRDSNPRPQPWQGCALPTELFPRGSGVADAVAHHDVRTRSGPRRFAARTRPSDHGGEGDRTPDLLNAIQALSQLSYAPAAATADVRSQGPLVRTVSDRKQKNLSGSSRWVKYKVLNSRHQSAMLGLL